MNSQHEALRLADCLEELEEHVWPKERKESAAELRRLHQANQGLLAALIEARQALQFANESPNGPISDTIWMMHRPETLFDFLDAAIDKAEGSTP